MRGKTTSILAIGTLILAAGLASAEDGPDYARSGGYLGLGLGIGIEEFRGGLDLPSGVLDTAYGIDAVVGYRVIPNLSVEGQVQWLPGLDFNVPGDDVSVDHLNFTGNFKGYLLTGQIQPWAVVGLGWGQYDVASFSIFDATKESGFMARFGAGLDAYLTEHIVGTMGFSYLLGAQDIEDADLIAVTVGAMYRF